MVSSIIKAVTITSGITIIALFLKALDLSLSESPIFWTSFLSWLKPPYLFVVINVIITVLVASSLSYHDGEEVEEEEEFLYDEYKIIETDQQMEVKNVDLDPDSDSSVLEVINGGDETSELNQESENLAPVEKPLLTVSSGHRKPVKSSQKGGKKKKVLKVVAKPKKTTTMEDTWKMVTEEGKSTPLTLNHRRSETVVVDVAGEVKQRALRKSVTFRDMTNYQRSPTTVTASPVKMKTEVSPSREELNRRVEAFIKKCKEERLIESMRLDKVVA